MAIVENPRTLNLDDIQGMLTLGYSNLYQTAYVSLKVLDNSAAKTWLKQQLPLVDSANHQVKTSRTVHFAFAAKGLLALGMKEENLSSFPLPFREGLNTEHRTRILGDYGENDPNNWNWGSNNAEEILMIMHAASDDDLDRFIQEQREGIELNGGLEIVRVIRGFLPEDNKEPFGFHDGISQPVIKGSGKPGPKHDIVATGEFLLGYPNEHNQISFSPIIEVEQGEMSLLPKSNLFHGKHDLGMNGSFMVFRQMEQDVDGFWKAMEEKTLNEDGSINEEAKIRLAAKCIGRWPSGASLVEYPDKDPGGDQHCDDFGYAETDPDGLKCPFGSHLRRNNPRDTLRWYGKEQSLKITKRHRIIRRGRTYRENDKTGLLFICFNADYELQFEFIQHVWANNNQMRHLTNDVDVIIGMPGEGNPHNDKRQFTVENSPVKEYYSGWDQFVTIKGGAYYFFPSITALNYITTI